MSVVYNMGVLRHFVLKNSTQINIMKFKCIIVYLLFRTYKINHNTFHLFLGGQNKIFKDKMSQYPQIIYYSPRDKMCLSILDLKPFRS